MKIYSHGFSLDERIGCLGGFGRIGRGNNRRHKHGVTSYRLNFSHLILRYLYIILCVVGHPLICAADRAACRHLKFLVVQDLERLIDILRGATNSLLLFSKHYD